MCVDCGCGLGVGCWVLGVELWNMMEHGTCRSVGVSSVDIRRRIDKSILIYRSYP